MNKQITVGAIVMIAIIMTVITTTTIAALQPLQQQSADGKVTFGAATREDGEVFIAEQKDQLAAPIAISGDNVYIVWPTNQTGNDEVNFRASTDGGTTFADKINLSNSTNAESQDVEIATGGDNIIVSWWERNATSNEPVLRISTDNGETFGPLLKLATNGTIGSGEGG